jgi:Domain of unknown function (DUF4287)/Domain of unknown function (DUF5655)
MSFQAYIENIKAKTGLSPDDFVRLAGEKGLLGKDVKAARVLDWLREDYGLGRGHGMAIVLVLQSTAGLRPEPEAALAEHFSGPKARWQAPYESLLVHIKAFGPDISVGAGRTYISLLRKGKKFAIVQVTGDRLDVGIKLGGAPASDDYEPAGSWNSMVTHRLGVVEPEQLDDGLVAELHRAYELAGEGKAAARA